MRQDTFDRLYTDHAARLYSFLAYRTGDPVLAEDLLADVFERALAARTPLDPRKGSELAWLYRIAINRHLDEARRSGREQRAYERASHDQTVRHRGANAQDVGDRQELLEALEVLTAEEREVVALRFGADLTVPEIAAALRTRLTTVDGRLYRALRKLRAELPDPADA